MDTHSFNLILSAGRRLELPPELCDDLGLRIGDTLMVRVNDNLATLSSIDRIIGRFQKLVSEQVPFDLSLVDELIGEREAASRNE